MPAKSTQPVLTHVLCAEMTCGPPLDLPHTNLLWDGTSRPGSVVMYECMDGFYQESGTNNSTCLLSGKWGKVSVKCQGTVIISTHKHAPILTLNICTVLTLVHSMLVSNLLVN